uniref:(northern house mosquito) hypothetical protein n=1 Tax=Culex pipiens TaxID=7175 RepID=A0A8D8FTY8_CULPI
MIVATASRSPISLGRSLRPSRCRGLRGTTRCPSSYRELLEMSRLWRLRGRWPVPGLPLPDTRFEHPASCCLVGCRRSIAHTARFLLFAQHVSASHHCCFQFHPPEYS